MIMKRLAMFVIVLLAISPIVRAETRNDGFTFYVQLIQGTDTESPPAAGATLIGDALGQRLHMFKWKNYWELKRQTVHLNIGDKTRQRLTKNRDVEIALPTADNMTVCIYLKGKLTRKRTQRVKTAFYIAGGEKDEAQSWFIVVRHDKPQNAPATEAKSSFGNPNQSAFQQLIVER
jgi:hypothetical protein